MNLPDKKYKIIYADVPWTYNDKANSGKRGANHKYPVMKLDDLKDLPINKISDDDCFLFLWATFPLLPEAFELIKSWGFEYKTVSFVWVKKNYNGTNFMGMGNWTRSNSEIVLLAVKGKPKRIHSGINQIIETIPKQHSRKPDLVRNRILKLCGDLPRIELFSRTKIQGWDVFGNDEKLQLEPLEEYF